MEDKSTPAMRQYYAAKAEHPDALIFFRMGDFYESFGEDAKLIAKELEITLTTRGKTKDGERMPLAGIPHHAIDNYLPRLIRKGYKVAICDQLEDPKLAKGVVRRGVTRVVTPGTAIDTSIITEASNNYLMVLTGKAVPPTKQAPERGRKTFGLAFLDISTGDFIATGFDDIPPYEKVISEAAGIRPSECIVIDSLAEDEFLAERLNELRLPVSSFSLYGQKDLTGLKEIYAPISVDSAEALLKKQYSVSTLAGMGLDGKDEVILACGKALQYALETQMRSLDYIRPVRFYSTSDRMVLDSITLRNLEILKNVRDDGSDYSLFRVLDRTVTPMGKRTLQSCLLRPLLSVAGINERLAAVAAIKDDALLRHDLKLDMSRISDIERLSARMLYGNSNARDLISMRNSLEVIPMIAEMIPEDTDRYAGGAGSFEMLSGNGGLLHEIRERLSAMTFTTELCDLITRAVLDEPAALTREGNMIRPGFSEELDRLRNASGNSKEWIAAFQNRERERTGIKSLKVGFNKVFGYFIEVTNTNKDQVPENYIRKQTMANGERYFTPELKEQEDLIRNADETAVSLEYDIFMKITAAVCDHAEEIREIAGLIGKLDVLYSFAEVSAQNNYVRPEMADSSEIIIRDGRHPVIESALDADFIPNDATIDSEKNQILLITGPNMAGKSTYMRQIAMIVIMAQAGCFVPASYAKIGIVDRIFTRIGAHDDLTAGQSTFMVEMVELANILNNSTARSLILLDEIGHGTSTYDGYSIAKAAVEFIHDKDRKGVRTLFATHYHQLTILEERLRRVRNYHIAVKESGHDLIFLRKIVKGATDKSYGIHVARLAGVPEPVIGRAEEILRDIEREDALSNDADDAGAGYAGASGHGNGNISGRSRRYTQLIFCDPDVEAAYKEKLEKEKKTAGNGQEETGSPETDPVLEAVREKLEDADINNMTPLQALSLLVGIKEMLRKP